MKNCYLGSLKAVILAGGLVTRISEKVRAKLMPMIEICGKPSCGTKIEVYK